MEEIKMDSNNIMDYKIAMHEVMNLLRANPDLFKEGINQEIKDIIEEVCPSC